MEYWIGRIRCRGVAVLAAMLLLAAFAGAAFGAESQLPKNIIILFADGAAPVQWDFGRRSSELLRQQPFATTQVMFREGTLVCCRRSRTALM